MEANKSGSSWPSASTVITDPRLLRVVSALIVLASSFMLVTSFLTILMPGEDETPILAILVNIGYSLMVTTLELSMASNSRFATQIAALIPFFKSRYGRSLFYIVPSLVIFFFLSWNQFTLYSSFGIGFCGLLLAVIAS